MAGEIIKGTVQANIVSVSNNDANILVDPNTNHYFNEIAAYNLELDNANILSSSTKQNNSINSNLVKLAVEQGKAFVSEQITFDANITAANVVNTIRGRIDTWISTYGNRYDDFQITINPSGSNHDITIVILRYF